MYGKYRPCGKGGLSRSISPPDPADIHLLSTYLVDQATSHVQEVTHGISDKWKTTVYAQFAAVRLSYQSDWL
jgi:hypothetical protein